MKTGYEDWDQNIKTLGGALFPDPSKAAHAYYYGTEARNALLKGAQTQESLAAGHSLTGLLRGDPRAQVPTYGPGPLGVTIMQDPYAGGGAPATAPAAPAPMPSLSAAVAGGPDAVGNAIVAGVEHHTQTGPGQEPTGSNGSVPQNGPGNIAPGSVTSAGGGGRTYAPPAAANGSPAPINLDFARVMDMGAKSGLNADQMQVLARSTLANMEASGKTPVPVAEELAALFGAPQMRQQVIANQGGLAQANVQAAAAIKGHLITAEASKANQAMVTGEARRQFDEAPVQVIIDNKAVTVPRSKAITMGLPHYDSAVANTAQGQTGAIGQYMKPGGAVTTMTAGQAVAEGVPQAAAGSDAQLAQVRQRIETEPDPVKRAQLVAQAQALAATPKEITPKQQAEQRAVEYSQVQRIYSTPQKGIADKFGVNDPAAFDHATDTEIDKRAYELANLPGNTYLKVDPAKAREAAIHDLMKNPTAEGMRLPTPAEVAQQRQPVRQRVATFGTYGDPRLDDYLSPYNKAQEQTAHMMIRMVPQDYRPPASGAAATSGAPATTNPAAAPPVATVVVPGSSAAQSPQQLYGGPVPGATPSPSLGGRIVQGAQAISQAGRATNPAPMSPAQIYGSQPAAAGAPVAAAPVASGGAPPGALGPAAPGLPEGAPVYGPGGSVGVNRGGWVYAR